MESTNPIPAPKSSLGELLKGGVPAVQGEVMKASDHNRFLSNVSAASEVRTEALGRKIMGIEGPTPSVMGLDRSNVQSFTRGDDVVDVERKRKGTIIKVMKAEGERKYELVDRKGNSWRQYESKLQMR